MYSTKSYHPIIPVPCCDAKCGLKNHAAAKIRYLQTVNIRKDMCFSWLEKSFNVVFSLESILSWKIRKNDLRPLQGERQVCDGHVDLVPLQHPNQAVRGGHRVPHPPHPALHLQRYQAV